MNCWIPCTRLRLHLTGEAFQVLDWLTWLRPNRKPPRAQRSYVFFMGKIWENNDQLSTSGFIYYSCIAKKNPKLRGLQVTKLVVGQMGMEKRGYPNFQKHPNGHWGKPKPLTEFDQRGLCQPSDLWGKSSWTMDENVCGLIYNPNCQRLASSMGTRRNGGHHSFFFKEYGPKHTLYIMYHFPLPILSWLVCWFTHMYWWNVSNYVQLF
jgi:hypothetical protein